MPDPTYDQIAATTVADLRRLIVTDNFFVETTTQAKMRAVSHLEDFLGGTAMQFVFQYDRVNGGAVFPGSDVTVTQKQILAAAAFAPKEYVEQIPINEWQTDVINSGPNAAVLTLDAYMSNALQALNTDLGLDLWRHGQASSGSLITNSRPQFINGFSEALNDGVTPSWDGNRFVNYGGQARNGAVGVTLNSVPIWMGTADGTTGQVSYKVLLEMYLDAVKTPDFAATNKALFAYLCERQEPKQGFIQEKDLSIGVEGLKLMGAYIHLDKLCPSTKYGSLLPSGLSQTTALAPSTFSSAGMTPNSISNLPTGVTINPGEVIFFLRLADWYVRPAASESYDFNFVGPIRSQNNPDLVVYFLRHGINFYTDSPRDNVHGYGAGF